MERFRGSARVGVGDGCSLEINATFISQKRATDNHLLVAHVKLLTKAFYYSFSKPLGSVPRETI